MILIDIVFRAWYLLEDTKLPLFNCNTEITKHFVIQQNKNLNATRIAISY